MANTNYKPKSQTPEPQGLLVNFESSITVKTVGGAEIKAKNIEIRKIIDNPMTKTIAAMTTNNRLFILWEGEAYDTIGNWTNEQVVDRVKELVLAGYNGQNAA